LGERDDIRCDGELHRFGNGGNSGHGHGDSFTEWNQRTGDAHGESEGRNLDLGVAHDLDYFNRRDSAIQRNRDLQRRIYRRYNRIDELEYSRPIGSYDQFERHRDRDSLRINYGNGFVPNVHRGCYGCGVSQRRDKRSLVAFRHTTEWIELE